MKIADQSGLRSAGGDIAKHENALERVRQLSRRLIGLQDEERRKIALQLHDTTGQNLVILAANLCKLRRISPSNRRKSRSLISECEKLTKECIREVRTLSYVLFPPMLHRRGLASAVRHYISGFSARTGIRVYLEVGRGVGRMEQDVELALFYAIQESLTNVHRHSGSRVANIFIGRDAENLVVEVTDHGHGMPAFEAKPGGPPGWTTGVGINGIMERLENVGGDVCIESSPSGTTMRVRVPTNVCKQLQAAASAGR